jgi:hypothetical protein
MKLTMTAMMLRRKKNQSFGCMLSIAVAELRSAAYHTLKKARIYPRLTTSSQFDFTATIIRYQVKIEFVVLLAVREQNSARVLPRN